MSHSSPDKKERSLDAWKLYTSIFNEFFGDYEGAYTLSPAVLLEFADRLKAQPANAFTEYNAALSARKPTSHDYFKRDDDLRHCKVCRGGEGSLPTDCPGEQMPESVESAVFAGALDFKDGAWVVRRSDGKADG